MTIFFNLPNSATVAFYRNTIEHRVLSFIRTHHFGLTAVLK